MTSNERLPDPPETPASRSDRWMAGLLLCATLLVYTYFFQGDGYNQHAHFNTARAVVERGSFEITEYARREAVHPTGDVTDVNGRKFSNKAPGLALAAAPAYAVVATAQRAGGVAPGEETPLRVNMYLTTVWASAAPGAVLAAGVFWWFRRSGSNLSEALLLACTFAFGTLVFPYASVLMVHNMVAACLFIAWLLVMSPRASVVRDALAGSLLGVALTTEYLVAPLLPLFALPLWSRPRRRASLSAFATGPLLATAALTAFHIVNFGSALSASYTTQRNEFRQGELFLGVFDWPDPRRVYWLTFHSFRGLFYCCPVLILSLLAFIAPAARRSALLQSGWIPLAVCAYFLLFNLTFNGWTGGWSIGPRYLIPAIPFLFIFTRDGLRRFPRAAMVLIVLSVCNMFAVAAVRLMFPANNFGPPPKSEIDVNPVAECIKRLTMSQVARNDGSFNVGMVLGLDGAASVAPAALLVVVVFAFVILRRRAEAQVHATVDRRDGFVPSPANRPPRPKTSALHNGEGF